MAIFSVHLLSRRAVRFSVGLVVAIGCVSFLIFRMVVSAPGLPVDQLQIASGRTSEKACAECHEQGETFWETGHARTLRRIDGSDGLLKDLAGAPAVRAEGTTILTAGERVRAVHRAEDVSAEINLGWRFGSGDHAHTWVATLADSWGVTDLMEFRWTWYHAIEGFEVTPGQPAEKNSGHFGGLGLLFDHPKARRCFGCHASHVPVDNGQIQEDRIEAGVTCQRCHGPAGRHVESDGEIVDFFSWKTADQLESVNRCAECHRREEEQDRQDIRPDNPDIVRFQPVGLVQSACFQGSDLTCITCHNPHLALEAQDSRGDWQCLQCHSDPAASHTMCGAGHTADCLRCHMPRLRMENPLEFTDHWIRIRNDIEADR